MDKLLEKLRKDHIYQPSLLRGYPDWLQKVMSDGKKLESQEERERMLQYINGIRADRPREASLLYEMFFPDAGKQDTQLGTNTPKMEKNAPTSFVGPGTQYSESTNNQTVRKLESEISQTNNVMNEDINRMESMKRKLTGEDQARAYKSIEQEFDTLIKGGPGSGKKGHKTAKKEGESNVVSLNNKLKDRNGGQAKETLETKAQAHLKQLESGAVLEGSTLKSGKPVFLNMEQATAHGYTPEDHKEAGNKHYDIAQQVQGFVDKYKQAGAQIPPEVEKIVKFHNKQFKAHFAQAQRIEDRQKKTEQDTAKKSVTQMGHFESGDIDTAEYAVALESAQNSKWLERLYSMMEGFEYGDAPRSIMLDKGELSLVKIDEGQYTGFFKKIQVVGDGALEDNQKIRIERITIPDLVQLLMAKEYVNPMEEQEPEPAPVEIMPSPEEMLNAKLAEIEDMAIDVVEQGIDTERILDKRIQLMQLVNKLLA